MKLTAVSLYVNGRRYTAFINLPGDNPVVTDAMLRDMFPVYRCMDRGETYSLS